MKQAKLFYTPRAEPAFKVGRVLSFNGCLCEILVADFRLDKWWYYINNQYDVKRSGWHMESELLESGGKNVTNSNK